VISASSALRLDAFPVEAFVLDELRVLRGDHRALQLRRDALIGHPLIRPAHGLSVLTLLGRAHRHERGLGGSMITPP